MLSPKRRAIVFRIWLFGVSTNFSSVVGVNFATVAGYWLLDWQL